MGESWGSHGVVGIVRQAPPRLGHNQPRFIPSFLELMGESWHELNCSSGPAERHAPAVARLVLGAHVEAIESKVGNRFITL